MPLVEYVLLALLGSGATGIAPANTTLSADAIVQPNGGALSTLSIGQEEPPKKEGSRSRRELRRRHKHRRHGRRGTEMPKKDGGKRN